MGSRIKQPEPPKVRNPHAKAIALGGSIYQQKIERSLKIYNRKRDADKQEYKDFLADSED